MSGNNKPEIKLTEDTVENIRIMAPYLDERSQDRVYGMMLRMMKNLDEDARKVG